jgi:hypothetical protein
MAESAINTGRVRGVLVGDIVTDEETDADRVLEGETVDEVEGSPIVPKK